MVDYNSYLNPSSHFNHLSSLREAYKKSPPKTHSFINEDYHPHSSNRKDVNDPNKQSISYLNDIINKEKTDCSSINLCLRRKQIQIGEQIIQEQKRNHSLRHTIEKSPNKQLTKTHSSSCLSNSNNKHETSYIRTSHADIQAKIMKLHHQKKDAEKTIEHLMESLQDLKKRKNDIQGQLENKISQKESYEEIYRYNVSIYNTNVNKEKMRKSNQGNGAVNENVMLTCSNVDNVIILKEELTTLTIDHYKNVIIMLLSDLFNGRRSDMIYQNLIEELVVKFYNAINGSYGSKSGIDMIDTLILNLCKELCDMYKMLNEEILHVLLKYSIKQQYIDHVIGKEMHFISKEYKSKKRNDKAKIVELKEFISKCEAQLIEAKNKENELLKQLEGINNEEGKMRQTAPVGLCKKENCPEKKKLFEYEYDNQEEINEQSFGKRSKGEGRVNEKDDCDLLKNLLYEKKKVEKQIEDNLLISNKKINEYNNKIEEINGANSTYMKYFINNNNSNETKSTFHRSASNTGNTFMKNEGSCSWIIDDNNNNNKANNHSHITKLPHSTITHDKHQHINRNDYIPSYSYRNKSNNNFNSKSAAKYAKPKQSLVNTRQLLPLNNSNNTNNNISIVSNSCKVHQKDSCQSKKAAIVNYPPLEDTYCYYRPLTTKDKKYNPLLSHYSPETIGYEKGFIVFDSIKKVITITESSNMKHVQKIPLNTVKSTAIVNHSKDIYHIHRAYQKFVQRSDNANVDINKFVKREEFSHIKLTDDDKIKAALCSFFSFSLVLTSHDIIELIFVSYNEFKMWLNGLSSLIKASSSSIS